MKTARTVSRRALCTTKVDEPRWGGLQSAEGFSLSWGSQSWLQAGFQPASLSRVGLFRALLHDACEKRSRRKYLRTREWSVQIQRRPERPPAGTIACPTLLADRMQEWPKPSGERSSPDRRGNCKIRRTACLRARLGIASLCLPEPAEPRPRGSGRSAEYCNSLRRLYTE